MKKSIHKPIFRGFAFLLIGVLLQGCFGAAFLSKTHDVEFRTEDQESGVVVDGEDLGKGGGKKVLSTKRIQRYRKVKIGSGEGSIVKEKTRKVPELDHSVEIYKKGYRSKFKVFYPEKRRPLKAAALDFGIPLVTSSGIALAVPNGGTTGETAGLVLTVTGIIGGPGFILDAFNNVLFEYPDQYVFEAPTEKIPSMEGVEKEFFIGNMHLNLDPTDTLVKTYKKKEDLKEGEEPKEVNGIDEEKAQDLNEKANSSYGDSLNKILDHHGYLEYDEEKRDLKLSYYNTVKFSPTIQKFVFHRFEKYDFYFLEMDVKWHVVTSHSDTIDTFLVRSRSGEFDDWKDRDQTKTSFGNPAFFDGLYASLIKLTNKREVQEILKRDELTAFENKMDNWKAIPLKGHPPEVKDTSKVISEQSKRVVTVKGDEGHGSGCILSSEGYIVTNYHVVNPMDSLTVILKSGERLQGKRVRQNPVSDLALIKVDTAGLQPMPLPEGDSPVAIGEQAYAIGTPKKLGLGQTVSKGIVSGKREFNKLSYLQTDVSINSGSSGGALVNEAGQLAGITNAKLKGGTEGIGFAIPISSVLEGLKLERVR